MWLLALGAQQDGFGAQHFGLGVQHFFGAQQVFFGAQQVVLGCEQDALGLPQLFFLPNNPLNRPASAWAADSSNMAAGSANITSLFMVLSTLNSNRGRRFTRHGRGEPVCPQALW